MLNWNYSTITAFKRYLTPSHLTSRPPRQGPRPRVGERLDTLASYLYNAFSTATSSYAPGLHQTGLAGDNTTVQC